MTYFDDFLNNNLENARAEKPEAVLRPITLDPTTIVERFTTEETVVLDPGTIGEHHTTVKEAVDMGDRKDAPALTIYQKAEATVGLRARTARFIETLFGRV